MTDRATTLTRRQQKVERRDALLRAAAALFAEHGYSGVTIEDLGAAVGVSGPAVYKHFASKNAVLAALLVDVSEGLFVGGEAVVADAAGHDALTRLIAFHTSFALSNPAVIRVQDRDLDQLAHDDRHTVRTLQRRYVELWVGVLADIHPDRDPTVLRMRAHAVFGLLNSTPHSGVGLAQSVLRPELERMALAALS